MDTLEQVIDRAAELCGSQNELGRRIGLSSSNLAQAKLGKKPLPKEKVAAIAAVVNMEPGVLWLIAQDARNPFKHSAPGALAGLVAAVLAGVLSLFPAAETRAATGTYNAQASPNGLHIVTHQRDLKRTVFTAKAQCPVEAKA
jgi:hypothetical protein